MKKYQLFLCALLSALAVAGCSSSPAASSSNAQSPTASTAGATDTTVTASPVIGKEGIPQPPWVRKLPRAADVKYFIGEGRDGRTSTARKNNALEDAHRSLAAWKSGTIKSAIKDYVQEAGETGNTQSLEFLEVSSITRAQGNTSGLKDIETWLDPAGNYLILFEYPVNDLKNDFKASVNEFVRNESAAYAEFKADEAFRYLEKRAEE
jgi:hypothetical protein